MKTIEADAAAVWSLLMDFGSFYRVNPFIECSPIINGVRSGVGAERRCEFYDGSSITERVVEVRDDKTLVVAITATSLPLNDGKVEIHIADEGNGRTSVAFDLEFTPKFGAPGRVLGWFLKPVLASRFNLVIRGIGTYLATSEEVGPKTALVAAS